MSAEALQPFSLYGQRPELTEQEVIDFKRELIFPADDNLHPTDLIASEMSVAMEREVRGIAHLPKIQLGGGHEDDIRHYGALSAELSRHLVDAVNSPGADWSLALPKPHVVRAVWERIQARQAKEAEEQHG